MRRWSLMAMAAFLAACSGSSEESSPSSGLPTSERVATLDETEIAELCDWSAAQTGGYGVEKDCGNGQTARTQESQAECVQSMRDGATQPECTVTVGQVEDCINALDGDLCQLIAQVECLPLWECAG